MLHYHSAHYCHHWQKRSLTWMRYGMLWVWLHHLPFCICRVEPIVLAGDHPWRRRNENNVVILSAKPCIVVTLHRYIVTASPWSRPWPSFVCARSEEQYHKGAYDLPAVTLPWSGTPVMLMCPPLLDRHTVRCYYFITLVCIREGRRWTSSDIVAHNVM